MRCHVYVRFLVCKLWRANGHTKKPVPYMLLLPLPNSFSWSCNTWRVCCFNSSCQVCCNSLAAYSADQCAFSCRVHTLAASITAEFAIDVNHSLSARSFLCWLVHGHYTYNLLRHSNSQHANKVFDYKVTLPTWTALHM